MRVFPPKNNAKTLAAVSRVWLMITSVRSEYDGDTYYVESKKGRQSNE